MSQPDFRARIVLEAKVSPSEDPSKVAKALRRVVGDAMCEESKGETSIRLATEDPKAFIRIRDQLRDRHIRLAARRQLLLNTNGRSTSVMLNRQAASVGVIAICGSSEESPLGPIYLMIKSDRLEAVIDWLAA